MLNAQIDADHFQTFRQRLGFHIGHTLIELEYPLQAAIALGLLGLGLYWGYRFMSPATQTCPDCLSEIPREAVVCRYCTTQVGEATDQ